MIIADLHHLQVIEECSIVGGDGSSLSQLLNVTYQQASLTQLGLSSAQAVSLVGNASGYALSVNIPDITQSS